MAANDCGDGDNKKRETCVSRQAAAAAGTTAATTAAAADTHLEILRCVVATLDYMWYTRLDVAIGSASVQL